MAQEVRYVLYSETRNIMYEHDQDHTHFWSKYLKLVKPFDRWFTYKDTEFAYIEKLRTASTKKNFKRIVLFDSTDRIARKIVKDIFEAQEKLATHAISAPTFVVVRDHGRTEEHLLVDTDISRAVECYKSKRADSIEVWVNGKRSDVIYDVDYALVKYRDEKTIITKGFEVMANALGIKTIKPFKISYTVTVDEFIDLCQKFLLEKFSSFVEFKIIKDTTVDGEQVIGLDVVSISSDVSITSLAAFGISKTQPFNNMIVMVNSIFDCDNEFYLETMDDGEMTTDIIFLSVDYKSFIENEGWLSQVESSY